MRKAAAAIKAVDPDAVVIHNNEGEAWLNALKYHAADYAQTDGVDIHPYPTNPPRDGVESRFSELDTNSITWPTQYLGRRMQCWVGESGMSTYTPKDSAKVYHFTSVSETYQAACEVRTVVQGLVSGVKAWCIYDFVNESNDPTDVESNFGIIKDYTHNYEPKPAFYSLQRLARLLGSDWQSLPDIKATLDISFAAQPKTDSKIKAPSAQMHWFRVGANYVTILWKGGGETDFTAAPALGRLSWTEAPKGCIAEAVDLVTGKSVVLKSTSDANGTTLANVPVGWAPVAIRWSTPAATHY